MDDGGKLEKRFEYLAKEKPNGLTQAFVLDIDFLDKDSTSFILRDHMLYKQAFSKILKEAKDIEKGKCVFCYCIRYPSAYRVARFDENDKALSRR